MIRRPPRSTRTANSSPTLRSSDLILLEIILCRLERHLRCLGLWLAEIAIVGLVENHTILHELHEEDAAMRERVIHLLERMNDEVGGRLDRLLEQIGIADALLGILPDIGRASCRERVCQYV